MKTQKYVSLEQTYLKLLTEDSEMDFFAQQDPEEVYPLTNKDNIDINPEYEKYLDDVVEAMQDAIQGISAQAEMDLEKHRPELIRSAKFFTDVITKLVDRLKPPSR